MGAKRRGTEGSFDLKSLIQARYPSLPENQRKVANYLLEHLQDVPFLSVVEIEKKCGASKATVVRLAQNLGFTGFQEVREQLMEGVQSAIKQKDKFSLLRTTDHEDTLTIVASQDVKNINRTTNRLDREIFREVAGMILKASHVYTAGLGISALMSKVLAYSLNQVAVKATAFVHDYETFPEQVPFLSASDLLLAFSFPPYSKETVELARLASKADVPVVALTDKETSPITFFSKSVIPIRSENMLFTNSFSAISVVINALSTEVAVRNKGKAMKMTKEIDDLLEEGGYYTTG